MRVGGIHGEAESYGSQDRKTEREFQYVVLKPTQPRELLFDMPQKETAALSTHNTYHRRRFLASQGTR